MTGRMTITKTNDLALPEEKKPCPAEKDPAGEQLRLWSFLSGHLSRYTMGESTSLPKETVDALVTSLLYTWGLDPEDPAVLEKLPEGDLNEAYRRGVRRLRQKTAMGLQLWRSACAGRPKLPNRSLLDTLGSIGGVFRRYDVLWLAQELPCDIDYQLCAPVPERLLGMDYLNEYLRRLLLENDFLTRFDPERCTGVLEHSCRDWREQVENLYEPAAAALGAALTRNDVLTLKAPPERRAALERMLDALPPSQMETALRRAADAVCTELHLDHAAGRRYLSDAAAGLCPRIRTALDAGTLENIFMFRDFGSPE